MIITFGQFFQLSCNERIRDYARIVVRKVSARQAAARILGGQRARAHGVRLEGKKRCRTILRPSVSALADASRLQRHRTRRNYGRGDPKRGRLGAKCDDQQRWRRADQTSGYNRLVDRKVFLRRNAPLLFAGKLGDYYRPIVDGSYQIAVEAAGYEPAMRIVNVTNRAQSEAQIVNFLLRPQIADDADDNDEAAAAAAAEIDDTRAEPQYMPLVDEDYQLSPEQSAELIQLVAAARARNKLRPAVQ